MARRRPETLISNLVYMGTARAGVVCMNLVATRSLAHALGAENFGVSSFATSYVMYFLIVVNLGLDPFLAREVACDGTRMRALVNSIIAMRLLLAVGMNILLFLSLPFLHLSPMARMVVLIQSISLFSAAIGVTCAYQGLQRMRVIAARETLAGLVAMLGILWLVHSPDDLVKATCVVIGAQLLTNIMVLTRYASEFGMPRLRFPRRDDIAVARRSMAYFWSLLMTAITYNMHIVMLGLMRSNTELGLFSAGWKLFVFSTTVPGLIAILFLPRIANLMTRPAERQRSTEIFLKAIIVCALPIAAFGSLLTPQILVLLFGKPYLPASRAVVLLLLSALVVSVNMGFGSWMTAVGRQRALFRVVAIGAAVDVALNLALIPAHGAEGAALATFGNEAVILGLLIHGCPEVPKAPIVDFSVRCLFAIIPAGIAVKMISLLPFVENSNLNTVLLGGAAGILIYGFALRLLRVNLVHFAADLRSLQ